MSVVCHRHVGIFVVVVSVIMIFFHILFFFFKILCHKKRFINLELAHVQRSLIEFMKYISVDWFDFGYIKCFGWLKISWFFNSYYQNHNYIDAKYISILYILHNPPIKILKLTCNLKLHFNLKTYLFCMLTQKVAFQHNY